MTVLRPYQREAIDAVRTYWAAGGDNPLVDLATGTGKSVVIATLIRELMTDYPGLRVLMLVHVKELVAQNFQALVRSWPGAPAGINSAGLGKRDTRSPILFASIQSVHRRVADLGPRDLVIVDEAHLIPKGGSGMYRSLLDELRASTADVRIAGFTATPYRLDTGRLDKGDDRLFDEAVYSYGIGQGIRDGFLSPLVSKATATAIDVSSVARRGGEFIAGALEEAVDKDIVTKAAVDEILAFGERRRAWLVFCTGVAHATHVRDEVRSRGIACEAVTGDTSSGERDRIIRDFREGRLRCLTNANVLTTGFDAPVTDMIAMLRPTLSTGLYVQILGRGTRLAPGKENCLVLDFAGNVRRHGPVDQVTIGGRGGASENGAVSVERVAAKACPNCGTLAALNARTCETCDHVWTIEDAPKHDARADAERPIMSAEPPAWVAVTRRTFAPHVKYEKPTSLRVEYWCGLALHREWVCFEHTGYARTKAENWWRRQGGSDPVPVTVDEAIRRAGELRTVTEIKVKAEGKFFAVTSWRFEEAGRIAA